ncbi:MAG: hypothetical protein M0R75_10410 [Dehalococcoidia bacterium]|nr:hypothetical protein [Dehalococcoidia bacterium]
MAVTTSTVRVVLPLHLRRLAEVDGEVALPVEGHVTQRAILDALEATYPVLAGLTRDRATARRRPLVRFFACGEDLSNEDPDALLPEAVATGAEPYMVVGSMAGG